MKIRRVTLCGLIAGLLMICGPVFAHHGTNASYDTTKHITLTGTVTQFVWANPHMQIYFDVKDEKGNVVHWAGEIPDPPFLAQKAGWTRDSIKSGDQVTITGSPSKAGTPVMVVRRVVLPNGKTLEGGGSER